MEESEIEEGNKLITKFKYNGFVSTKVTDWIEGFPYHKDWNELMPIVEKIESLQYSTSINYGFGVELPYQLVITQGNYFEFTQQAGEKITAVYKGVVEFIKWYNKKEV